MTANFIRRLRADKLKASVTSVLLLYDKRRCDDPSSHLREMVCLGLDNGAADV